jgi:lipoprotein-anchoring transpeptidase ErfK/SrfK
MAWSGDADSTLHMQKEIMPE